MTSPQPAPTPVPVAPPVTDDQVDAADSMWSTLS